MTEIIIVIESIIINITVNSFVKLIYLCTHLSIILNEKYKYLVKQSKLKLHILVFHLKQPKKSPIKNKSFVNMFVTKVFNDPFGIIFILFCLVIVIIYFVMDSLKFMILN